MKQKLILVTLFITLKAISYGQAKMESYIEQSYSNYYNTYENYEGNNFEYDTNGNLTSETRFRWNETDQVWLNSGRALYTFDSNNKCTEALYQIWNANDGQYIDDVRRFFIRDSNGILIEFIDQEWINNQWKNYEHMVFNYENNKRSEIIVQEFIGNNWVNIYRSLFTYSNDKLTQILDEPWDGSQWTSDDSTREVFEYNDNKDIIIYESWNGTSWIEDERTESNMDDYGNLINETYIRDENPYYIFEYSHDTSYLLNDFIHPFNEIISGWWFDGQELPIVHKILSQTEYFYNSSTSTIDISGRIIFNYDNQILSTQNFEDPNKISVFPNPSNDFIKISGLQKNENISIYNLLGKLVMKKNISPNQEIDIRVLSDGIYFMKMENKKTIKLIKN